MLFYNLPFIYLPTNQIAQFPQAQNRRSLILLKMPVKMAHPHPPFILDMRKIPRLLHHVRKLPLDKGFGGPAPHHPLHLRFHHLLPDQEWTLLTAEPLEPYTQKPRPQAFHHDDEPHVVGVHLGSIVGVESSRKGQVIGSGDVARLFFGMWIEHGWVVEQDWWSTFVRFATTVICQFFGNEGTLQFRLHLFSGAFYHSPARSG